MDRLDKEAIRAGYRERGRKLSAAAEAFVALLPKAGGALARASRKTPGPPGQTLRHPQRRPVTNPISVSRATPPWKARPAALPGAAPSEGVGSV